MCVVRSRLLLLLCEAYPLARCATATAATGAATGLPCTRPTAPCAARDVMALGAATRRPTTTIGLARRTVQRGHRTRRCRSGRSRIVVFGRIGLLLATRVRRVRDAVACAKLRPGHLCTAAAVKPCGANQADTRRLGEARPVLVGHHTLLEQHAPRPLLARVHKATGAVVGAACTVLARLG